MRERSKINREMLKKKSLQPALLKGFEGGGEI